MLKKCVQSFEIYGCIDEIDANFIQGAVESLLERSSYVQLLDGSVVELDNRAKKVILDSLNELSSSALRVLGFAYKEDPPEFTTYNGDEDHPAHNLLLDPANYSSIESNLIFAGLAGLRVSEILNGFFGFPFLSRRFQLNYFVEYLFQGSST